MANNVAQGFLQENAVAVAVIDDLEFFMETRDITVPGAIVFANSTATGSNTSGDLTNTGPGAAFFLNFTAVQATCTARLSIVGRDPVSQNYSVIATLSVDGISTTNVGQLSCLYVYPGATGTPSGNGGGTAAASVALPLPRVFQAIVSISATASAGGAGLNYTVGMTRIGGM